MSFAKRLQPACGNSRPANPCLPLIVPVLMLGAGFLSPACVVSADVEIPKDTGHAILYSARFSADGRWLVTKGEDREGNKWHHRVIQWDANTGAAVRSFSSMFFDISPDGKSLLIVDGKAQPPTPTLISLESGHVLQRIHGIRRAPINLSPAMTTDGRYFVFVRPRGVESLHEVCWIWDSHERRMIWDPEMPLPFRRNESWRRTFANASDWLVGYVRTDHETVLFCRGVRPDGHTLTVNLLDAGILFTPDGRRMLTRTWSDTGSPTDVTLLWDVKSGMPVADFYEPFDAEEPFQYSPDGKLFVRGIGENAAAVHDVATGAKLRLLEGHTDKITSFAFASDGKTIFTGSMDGTAITWNVANGRRLSTIDGMEAVYSMRYVPKRQQLLLGTRRGFGLLYDLRTKKMVREFGRRPLRSPETIGIVLSPLLNRMATISSGHWRDSHAVLWNIELGDALAYLRKPYQEE